MRIIDADEVVKYYKNIGKEFPELSVNLNNIDTVKNVHLGGKTAMTKYSDIEIQTAQNLLKRGFKWITRGVYGAILAYKIKPDQEKYGYGNVICSDLVPIFESVKIGDEPVSLERIVYPQILDDVEKKYLSAVIKPFRKRVKHISKEEVFDCSEEFIHIELSDGDISDFPNFKANTMYKGMKLGCKYTLEELGL